MWLAPHPFNGRRKECKNEHACVFLVLNQAKLIEFQPLRATDVKLPDGAVFVISNCCVEMNKAASSHFNIRVVECRIATKV